MRGFILTLHLVFIALGTGLSFSQVVNVTLAKSNGADFAKGLGLQRRMVARIGDGVIAAIWLTGLALYWNMGPNASPWFHAKLVFVFLLTVCHAMARRTGGQMMRAGNTALLGRLHMFMTGVFVSAIAAISLAVMAFG